MTGKKTENINFEKSIDALNSLVEKMEQGNLPLEDSLTHFEKGIHLIRECQQALKEAEQKVQILSDKEGKTLTDFNSEQEENGN